MFIVALESPDVHYRSKIELVSSKTVPLYHSRPLSLNQSRPEADRIVAGEGILKKKKKS